jgi:fluoride exporter
LKAAIINAALVGSGGFVGAICRYGLSGFVQRRLPLAAFPYGTLVVNLCGCLLIGALAGLVESRQVFGPEFRLFVLIGVLGGFTTYSTFGYESFALLRDAEYLRAVLNVTVHVVFGLTLVGAGYALASR